MESSHAKFKTYTTGTDGKTKRKTKKIKISNRNTGVGVDDMVEQVYPFFDFGSDFEGIELDNNIPEVIPNRFELFPFHQVWYNSIDGCRFRINALLATQQLHIIQDFEFGKFFLVSRLSLCSDGGWNVETSIQQVLRCCFGYSNKVRSSKKEV